MIDAVSTLIAGHLLQKLPVTREGRPAPSVCESTRTEDLDGTEVRKREEDCTSSCGMEAQHHGEEADWGGSWSESSEARVRLGCATECATPRPVDYSHAGKSKDSQVNNTEFESRDGGLFPHRRAPEEKAVF